MDPDETHFIGVSVGNIVLKFDNIEEENQKIIKMASREQIEKYRENVRLAKNEKAIHEILEVLYKHNLVPVAMA